MKNRHEHIVVFWFTFLSFSSCTAASMFIKSSAQEQLVNFGQEAGDQLYPSVVTLSSGEILFAYASPGDTSGLGIYLTKPYNDSRSFTRANTYSENDQTTPILLALEDGFIVLWLSNGQDKSGYGIYGQKFTNSLRRVGSEFRINASATGDQGMPPQPSIHNGVHFHAATNKDKTGFLVVWVNAPSGSNPSGYYNPYGYYEYISPEYEIFGRYFDQNGNPLTGDFQINNYTKDYQMYPRVAAIGSELFCVTWDSRSSLYDSGKWSGYYKIIDKYGNSNNTCAILVPDLKILIDDVGEHWFSGVVDLGNEKMLLFSKTQSKNPPFIAMQVLYTNGTRIGQQRKIISSNSGGINYNGATTTIGEISSTSFTAGGQRFAVFIWSSMNCDGFDYGIQAALVDSHANVVGSAPFLANREYVNTQNNPQLSVVASSNASSVSLIFTYQSNGARNTGFDILARPMTFDLSNYKAFLPDQLNPTFISRIGEQNFGILSGTNVRMPWVTVLSNGSWAATCVNDPGTTPLNNGSPGGASTDLDATRVISAVFQQYSSENTSNVIQTNIATKDTQTTPIVATLANDNLVACWTSNNDGWKIVCSIFDKNQNRIGDEFTANTNNLGDGGNPNVECSLAYCNNRFDLIALGKGNAFVIVFSAGNGNELDIYAVIYKVSSTGARLFRPDFLINIDTNATQAAPRIAELLGGGFVVLWVSNWNDYDNQWDIYGRVFDGNFDPITEDIKINQYARYSQYSPSMIVLENGNIVATWIDIQRSLLVTQIMDSQLNFIGGENTFGISLVQWYELPRGVHIGNNYYVITLTQGNGKDGDGNGCFVAFFDPNGKLIGDFMQVSQTYRGNQQNCQIAKFPNENRLVVIWDSTDPTTQLTSVSTCQYIFIPPLAEANNTSNLRISAAI